MWLGICARVVVSILLGGAVGLTLQQLGFDDEIILNPGDVAGLRVLITGASSGIGEQLAYLYSQHGARVYITARQEDQLKRVTEGCRQKGSPQAGYVVGDFTRMLDATRVVHMAQKSMGGLDQMVLGQAYFPPIGLWVGRGSDLLDVQHVFDVKSSPTSTWPESYIHLARMAQKSMGGLDQVVLGHAYFPPIGQWVGRGSDLSDVQHVFDVNVKSYIHLATHALPYLKASNGSLGIISSVAAKLYVPYRSLYTMTKHALDGFFSTLRVELRDAGLNVSVTSCILGAVDTLRKRRELEETEEAFSLNLKQTYSQLASSEAAAHAIMSAITARKREIYFPPSQNVKARILFGELFPLYSEIPFAFPILKR